MPYDRECEMNRIATLNTFAARRKYLVDIVNSHLVTYDEGMELVEMIVDKYPHSIFERLFKSGDCLWTSNLKFELNKLRQPQSIEDRNNSAITIINMFDQYGMYNDLRCKREHTMSDDEIQNFDFKLSDSVFSLDDVSNLAVFIYHPNLFNKLVESIKNLSQPAIKNIVAKLLHGMHVRPANYRNQQEHINYLVSMFATLPPEWNVIVPLLEDKLILNYEPWSQEYSKEEHLQKNSLYRDFLNQFYLSFKEQQKFDTNGLIKKIILDNKASRSSASEYSFTSIRNLHPEIQQQMIADMKKNPSISNYLGIYSVRGEYCQLTNGFNLFTDFICLDEPVRSKVFQHFNELNNNKKTAILCHKAEVVTQAKACDWDDYGDSTRYHITTVEYTPLKRVVETNISAIPELIQSIEQLPIKDQAAVWQQEASMMVNYPKLVKSGFYLFKLN